MSAMIPDVECVSLVFVIIMKFLYNKKLPDDIGCFICLILVFILIFFASNALVHFNNKQREEAIVKNKQLVSQEFEIKKVYLNFYGKNPSFMRRECIAENTKTKERVIVRFDDDKIPLVGDLWIIQILVFPPYKNYKLSERLDTPSQ